LAYRTANFRIYIPRHVVDPIVETVKGKTLWCTPLCDNDRKTKKKPLRKNST